jgi:hypothetical protein
MTNPAIGLELRRENFLIDSSHREVKTHLMQPSSTRAWPTVNQARLLVDRAAILEASTALRAGEHGRNPAGRSIFGSANQSDEVGSGRREPAGIIGVQGVQRRCIARLKLGLVNTRP